MDMVVVLGKSRKNVQAFILLPPDAKSAIDTLLATRDKVKVMKTNIYIFARLNADTPPSGTGEMKDVAYSCPGIKYPEKIT